MKTQKDCWRALVEGKTLQDRYGYGVKFENGVLKDTNKSEVNWHFRFEPELWSIAESKKVLTMFRNYLLDKSTMRMHYVDCWERAGNEEVYDSVICTCCNEEFEYLTFLESEIIKEIEL